METKETLEIELYQENGVLEIKDFNELKNGVMDYISRRPITHITNDIELDELTKLRTQVNKMVETLSTTRKNIEKEVIGTFKSQCTEIEKILGKYSDDITKELNVYKENNITRFASTPKIITATIKFYDTKKIELLAQFCETNGLTLSIK